MTRLEELTLKLADGALTDLEARELDAMLAGDTQAETQYRQLLELEAALRGQRENLDLAAPTLARLRTGLAVSVERGVMQRLETEPPPAWMRASSRCADKVNAGARGRHPHRLPRDRQSFQRARPAIFAFAASVIALLGLSLWYFTLKIGEPALAEVNGTDVSVERGTEFIPASARMLLLRGDVLHIGTNASALLAFGPERTTIHLTSGTEFTLTSFARGKRFQLHTGTLEASVSRQRPFRPMIITTPNAEARVLGTQFTLTAATNRTQLDVTEGKVRLADTANPSVEPVKVSAGHSAVVAPATRLAALPQTGSIFREYWTSTSGKFIQTLDFSALPEAPDPRARQEWLDRLETPNGWGENYAARWRGYLHPPATGRYEISLSASHEAAIYLSRDDQPEHKANSMIIQWHQNPTLQRTQNVKTFEFVAGQRYYIELLHKAGKGANHLSVTWKRPDGQTEVIPGECLSPFKPRPKEKQP